MEVVIIVLGVVILIWTLVSGSISISRAWKRCMDEHDASHFMSYIWGGISGNLYAIGGIILLCLPVWLILKVLIGNKRGNIHASSEEPITIVPTEEVTQLLPQNTKRFSPPVKITIGRNRSCHICVDEKYEDVSRHHATITIEFHSNAPSFILEDKSTYGSFINGEKISNSHKQIYQNDQIRLGYKFLLSWNEINRFLSNINQQRKT